MAGWFWLGFICLFIGGQLAVAGAWVVAAPLLLVSCIALRIYFLGVKK